MTAAYSIIALVAIQRIAELLLAARNTKALLRRGAVEIGQDHYPLIVLFHATWLVAIAVWLPQPTTIHLVPLACFIALQAARIWVIATLGPYWTTRIITLENAPLVRRGPYRFLRHPNYLVVALEVFTLPLVFGEFGVALISAVVNLGLLVWRIRIEETALSARRALSEGAAIKF
ncbi:MAG TPA: isoprenylcysteine carboxylmethyltransferase family protein [Alphaproteobacteria bacterium]|nr:isoprenylcysteine carboxylmethyltransferase family protein [Alphaproteobacteria bacterium]